MYTYLRKIIVLLLLATCLAGVAAAQYDTGIHIEPLLKTDTTSVGQFFQYPDVTRAEVTMLRITIEPGAATAWHRHEIPLFAYMIKGELTVTFDDDRAFTFREGDAIAEGINIWHQGKNTGDIDVVLIALYLGGDGLPLAETQN